ncbi:hypothetical protein R1sor_027226 [Riccia sorocarpa]|uniref:Uncharacterized protein n=1 Tax=Riccia sorocarpa TaxID=122646 RepID=A0ABD3GDL6_9MARC
MLKGRNLWLDDDLTPSQAENKRKELKKVKEANEEGWVAYLRDGKAVITQRRSLWKDADIVILVETWEFPGNTETELVGFSRVASLWNEKRLKGRGFGGVAVWTRFAKTLRAKTSTSTRLRLDKTARDRYEREIALHVHDMDSASSIGQTLVRIAKQAFPWKNQHMSWFDIECKNARLRTLDMEGTSYLLETVTT